MRHVLADSKERHHSTADGCSRRSFASLWRSSTDIHLPSQLDKSQRMAHCQPVSVSPEPAAWADCAVACRSQLFQKIPPTSNASVMTLPASSVEEGGRGRSAHRESEASASSFDREHCSAQVAVILEVVHHRLACARLHTPINAHVSGLCPAQRDQSVFSST